MPNTYTQLTIHCVFSVRGRKNLLEDHFRDRLFKFMHGILRNDGAFPLAVNGWTDHVHVLFECPPNMTVSDLICRLKSASSKWINEQQFVAGKFNWQAGYGAFSCSKSHRDRTIRYIINQQTHHGAKSFRDEYLAMLELHEIEFRKEYLFEFYDAA